MSQSGSTRLNSEQQLLYRDLGYYSPIRVLEEAEAAGLDSLFLSHQEENPRAGSDCYPGIAVSFSRKHTCA